MRMSRYGGGWWISSFERSCRHGFRCSVLIFFCYSSCNLHRWRRASAALRLTYNMSCHAGLLCGGRAVVVSQGAISFNLAAKWWRGTSVRWPSCLVSTEVSQRVSLPSLAPWTQLAGPLWLAGCCRHLPWQHAAHLAGCPCFCTARLVKAQQGEWF